MSKILNYAQATTAVEAAIDREGIRKMARRVKVGPSRVHRWRHSPFAVLNFSDAEACLVACGVRMVIGARSAPKTPRTQPVVPKT